MADLADDPVVTTDGDQRRDPEIPPRPKDKRPKDQKAPRSKASVAQTKVQELKRIRKGLEGILEAPALVISEPWPKEHIETQAPNLAAAILKKAEVDEEFRKKLNAFLSAGDGAGLILAVAMYCAPLAIYYGAPAPPAAKKMLKIPPRPGKLAPEDIEGIPPLPEETIVAEAAEHGYDDVEEYKQAVAKAVAANNPHAVMP